MKDTRKLQLLFITLGLMMILVACGGKDTERNSQKSVVTTNTYKNEKLGIEFDYYSDFIEVEDLSQVELLKNQSDISIYAQDIEVILNKENGEAILVALEESKEYTIDELKSSIDDVKALLSSNSKNNELQYSINVNDIIEINDSRVLKTELTTNGVKTCMLSFIKENKLISIQYVAKEDNYSEENIKKLIDSLKV